jgi:hypothetical protein
LSPNRVDRGLSLIRSRVISIALFLTWWVFIVVERDGRDRVRVVGGGEIEREIRR